MMQEVITRVMHDTSGLFSQGDVTDRPCPAITIGVGSMNACHYQVEYHLSDAPQVLNVKPSDKPFYRVPSMKEIAAIPWNGFNVASTFSGCGGSCLGYRMAGFRVLWANEFIPAAQDSYRANAVGSILDGRDIRLVKPEEILEAVGMKPGELDLFDGSPPCQAFSTAGKREKGWGKSKRYENGASQCNETLFTEYIRLLRGLQPKVFVAENVSGLVKGTAKGYFKLILAELKDCGYRVTCRVLDAQWLGVPQMRQRVIFVGVRNDLKAEPAHPKPLAYRYSVRDALPWIVRTGGIRESGFNGATENAGPCQTIMAGGGGGMNTSQFGVESETDISSYAIGAEYETLPPSRRGADSYNLQAVEPESPCPTVTIGSPGNDLAVPIAGKTEKRKFSIAELKRICAFPDDFILTGSYSDQWARLGNAVPPVMMFHIAATVQDKILKPAMMEAAA